MRSPVFAVIALTLAVTTSVRAQEAAPNAAPAATAKGGNVGKLNGQQKTNSAKQDTSPCDQVPPCKCCPNCCPIDQPQGKSKEEQAKDDSHDPLYRAYLWATIIGVVVALFGVGFISFQTKATKETVNSLRSAERAWILVTLEHPNELHLRYMWVLTIKNHGRTPARVTAAFGDMTDKLPVAEPPKYRTSILPGPKLLAPQEEWQIADVSTLNPTPIVCYYGYIEYRDTFSNKGERFTRFCYELKSVAGATGVAQQKWFPAGPKSYNDYT